MNKKSISVIVNGEQLAIDKGSSIENIIGKLGLHDANLIAELDGNIIKKADFKNSLLEDGAKLELIRFVGGG